MKTRLILLMALVLALPMAAMADTITFTNSGGSFTGNDKGLILTGADLTSITGLPGGPISGADIGTVSFKTGVLGNANVTDGGNILPGGSVTITGNGTSGAPTGVLFAGVFSQGFFWTQTMSDGTYQYNFTGDVSGTNATGSTATGQMTFTLNTGTGKYEGINTGTSNGTTTLAVPEPAELSLLGIGMLGLFGTIRRKLSL